MPGHSKSGQCLTPCHQASGRSIGRVSLRKMYCTCQSEENVCTGVEEMAGILLELEARPNCVACGCVSLVTMKRTKSNKNEIEIEPNPTHGHMVVFSILGSGRPPHTWSMNEWLELARSGHNGLAPRCPDMQVG